jgi:hypothetical protein
MMTNDEALEYSRATFNGAPFCLVRNWIWVELEVSEGRRDDLAAMQLHPVVLYAHSIVYDSSRRWDVGDFVRTTLLHEFTDGFVFRTKNMRIPANVTGHSGDRDRFAHGLHAGTGFVL